MGCDSVGQVLGAEIRGNAVREAGCHPTLFLEKTWSGGDRFTPFGIENLSIKAANRLIAPLFSVL